MLKAENRLRKSDEFRATVRRGTRVGRPLVVVHVVAGAETDAPTRVGFVVGRTVGGSVVRNAVRRRLRHLVGARLDRLPAGCQVVVRAQPEAAHAPGGALARDLDDALARVANRLGASS